MLRRSHLFLGITSTFGDEMSLAQGNNTPTRPRIEPGSPDPESDARTTRPVRSPLSKNKKNITFFHLKITIFTAVKYCSIVHRHVFVTITRPEPSAKVFIGDSSSPELSAEEIRGVFDDI